MDMMFLFLTKSRSFENRGGKPIVYLEAQQDKIGGRRVVI